MKKAYETPQLIVHGTVEEITQAFGNPATRDTIFLGSTVFGEHNGSQDGIIVPK
jgi:hypothetical protein